MGKIPYQRWQQMIGNRWISLSWILSLVLLPVLIGWGYQAITSYPDEITVVTGPLGGRYKGLGESLSREIEQKLNVKVNTVSTDGSLENLLLLQAWKADFALYQNWTFEVLNEFDPDVLSESRSIPQDRDAINVQLVANLYSQPAHFIVRRDAGIKDPADLVGKAVDLGLKRSGDYAMSLLLLDHFGLDRSAINTIRITYPSIKQAFLDGTLDAAFINIGVQAPILRELFSTGCCDLLAIPYAEALAAKHTPMYQYKIPAGRYRYESPPVPVTDIQTVALGAQLLTHEDVPAGLVEEVTKIVLSEAFMKKNHLGELFMKGHQFAQQNRAFTIHPGARSVYNPELSPLLDPKFVDATEGMRSFIFSFFIAGYFGVRWIRQKRIRHREHRLDKFLLRLMDIEQRQVSLGVGPNASDASKLQDLLNEVILLRLEALRGWSAHDLSEDRAVDCFIEMCNALSNKINAKLSRGSLELRLSELIETVKQVGRVAAETATAGSTHRSSD